MIKRIALVVLACGLALGSPAVVAQAAPTLEIFQVQGAGPTSPYAGQSVRIENSVVTAVFDGGFFLQTPDARADSPFALTAHGIRVLSNGWPTYPAGGQVMPADLVTVEGVVIEQDGETRLQPGAVLIRVDVGVALPAPVEFSLEAGRPRTHYADLYCQNGLSNFECYEGMRIVMPDAMVAAGNPVEPDRDHGAVYISPHGRRSLREKGVRFDYSLVPSNQLAGYWDSNAEILQMDASPLGALPVQSPLAGGTRFSAVGILTVVDGQFVFWPSSMQVDAASGTLPVPAGVAETASSYRVASFDLDRLCDAIPGNSSVPCDIPEPMDVDVANRIDRLAAYIVEVLQAPEVLAVQHVESQPLIDQLAAAASAQAGAGVSYIGVVGASSNPRGLRLGFLVRTDKMTIIEISERLTAASWDGAILHPMPPLLLKASFDDGGATHWVRVLNLHVDDRTGVDAGIGDVRERRFQQGLSIAGLVQQLQLDASATTAPLLVLGKLNDWVTTDGYVDVHGLISGTYFDPENLRDLVIDNPVSPFLTSIVELLAADRQITTMTHESFGPTQGESERRVPAAVALDHILLSREARRTATEFGLARGNADAPEILQSGMGGAVGSSAFDGVVVRMYPGCLTDPAANQDGDGWCDLFDNCPTVPNEDQVDVNGNGVGDVCEPEIDLSVTLLGAPDPVVAGGLLTVTATVTHAGGSTVPAPSLRVQLPRRFELQTFDSGPWSCVVEPADTEGPVLACAMPSIDPGQVELSLSGATDPTLPAGANLQFSAQVLPLDSIPDNNNAAISLGILPVDTDLRLLILLDGSPVLPVGGSRQFIIRVNNLGQRTADDVSVRIPQPAGGQVSVVAPDPGWACTSISLIECSRTAFAAGAQSDLLLEVNALPEAGTSLVVSPLLQSSTPDPDLENNSASLVLIVADGNPEADRIFRDGFEG